MIAAEHFGCMVCCHQLCCRFEGKDCCRFCPERVRELCQRFQLCRRGECLCSDTDTLLMAAFADGDDSAFDVLYRRNCDWAINLAFKFLGNRDDAWDVAQEAFLKVIANRNRWKPAAKFQTWFRRIVTNLSLKRGRSQNQVSPFSEFEDEESELLGGEKGAVVESPEATLLAVEQEEQLQRALERLPERQREALLLWSQGASYRQIAQHLGCSLSAVETLIHRAKRKLHKLFDA